MVSVLSYISNVHHIVTFEFDVISAHDEVVTLSRLVTVYSLLNENCPIASVLGSIVVSIPACHAGDRGSIPRRGEFFLFVFVLVINEILCIGNDYH